MGVVCEVCDAYNDPGVAVCVSCASPLAPASEDVAEVPSFAPRTATRQVQFAVSMPPTPVSSGEPPVWLSAPMGEAPAQLSGDYPALEPLRALQAACARCGTTFEPDDKFCRNCGARSGAEPDEPQAGAIAQKPANVTMMFGALPSVQRHAKLVLVRGQATGSTQWRLGVGTTNVGRNTGAIRFDNDMLLAGVHAAFELTPAGELTLEPMATNNGVFVRVKDVTPLPVGSEVVVGSQRLRVLAAHEANPGPTASKFASDPTTLRMGSLVKPLPALTLLHVGATQAEHQVYQRYQRLLTLGRSHCDVNFPLDSFVSERHAQIAVDELGVAVLEDLRSRNGTYVRVLKRQRLHHGDLLLMGEKVLRVELPDR